MINEHSLVAAELLAKTLADKEIAVTSKGDSYLSNLVGLSDIANVISANREMNLNETLSCSYDNAIHTTAVDKLVKNIHFANTSLLNVGKNNVIPLVNFMADKYSAHIADAESNAVLPLNVNIVPDDLYWDVDMFREAVKSIPDDYVNDVNLTIKFPKKDREEIELMSKTGFVRYDKLLSESLERYEQSEGVDVYQDVWDTIFSRDGERTVFSLVPYYKGNQNAVMYHLPVLWGILKYLSNESNIPSGLICSIAEYRDFVSNALYHVNSMLASYIATNDRAVKNRKVVIAFPSGLVDGKRKQTVSVKKSLYDEYLAEGGSIDAVLGAAITDREDTVAGLLDKKEFYETEWHRHYGLINSVVTSEIREIKRMGIKKSLIETAQEYDKQQLAIENPDIDPQVEGMNFRYTYWDDMPEDIRKFVENIDEHKLSEINYISQQLICDLLFPETDVYKILDSVNEYGKANPNASPKEALTLAIVDYIIFWLFDQLEFTKRS